ncbi:unnamed protein product [Polarella glacialis]|uniref:Uncharacterized protein n=1 Tax=Polarella glacialis TaxID=89957 RepID=A0A813GXG9_POLGL|nr:unnamed protein product [Polarella glacialis]
MEHNTNLFTDAQYLAVPAINFFGLPGYQQESPPTMPSRFFEDGKQAFLLRKAARRKAKASEVSSEYSPWFYFCGCPTSRVRRALVWRRDTMDSMNLPPQGDLDSDRALAPEDQAFAVSNASERRNAEALDAAAEQVPGLRNLSPWTEGQESHSDSWRSSKQEDFREEEIKV